MEKHMKMLGSPYGFKMKRTYQHYASKSFKMASSPMPHL
jgi:hypothetical protein